MQRLRYRRLVRPALLLMLLLTTTTSGCVRRRMLVRSNPPGAMVYIDNQPIGPTPCSTDFVYYGTREIRLVKPGYETLTINQPIPAPWYELPPLDFISENLVPREIQDYRTLSYNLQPRVIKPSQQLLGDAEQLRQYTQQGAVVPAGALGSPVAPGSALPLPAAPLLVPPAQQAPGVLVPPPGTRALPPGGQPFEVVPPPQ